MFDSELNSALTQDSTQGLARLRLGLNSARFGSVLEALLLLARLEAGLVLARNFARHGSRLDSPQLKHRTGRD